MEINQEVAISVLSLVGTALGAFGGIVASNKLTNFRLLELERKVDKHNKLVERTYVLEEQIKFATDNIKKLEDKVDN